MRQALDRSRLEAIYDRVSGRYDLQHWLVTAGSDQRGRRLVVERTVKPGDEVLDCGAGTGSTALLAARRAGPEGTVTLFDMSRGMLDVARRRAEAAGLERLRFETGNMVALPFPDGRFDAVLSTYSLCPLYDPVKGALELFRVARPGGRIGVAHSTTPDNPILAWLADRVERLVWRLPSVSLGCRTVTVLPTLESAGGSVVFSKRVGIPLWPFAAFVVEKPAS